MKGEINKLIGVAMLMLLCVSMWGCGDDDFRRWGG